MTLRWLSEAVFDVEMIGFDWFVLVWLSWTVRFVSVSLVLLSLFVLLWLFVVAVVVAVARCA